MFELAYACGLRAEELVSLRVDDVDYDGEQLRVEGKGRKTRFVPVGEPAMEALRRYLEPRRRAALRSARRARSARRPAQALAAEALFLSKTGRALGTSDVRRRLRTWTARVAPIGERAGAGCRRTRCATASPRTCSTAAPTCAASRSCSATPACRAPRFTLG